MSLTITQSHYFNAGYVQRVSPSEPTTATTETSTEALQDSTKAAPLTGFGSLLGAQDIRMLHQRGVSGDEKTAYMEILQAFNADPSHHENPVAFLHNLSPDGIQLLKKAQSLPLGYSVDFTRMDQEEALNFILPFTQQVDLNDDGFIGGGNGGTSFRFPPPNAPQNVKDAWNAATADMPLGDRLHMEFYFMMELTSANTELGPNGLNQTKPGDPEWGNVYANPDYSYRAAIARFQGANDFNFQHGGVDYDQYMKNKTVLSKLDRALAGHAVT